MKENYPLINLKKSEQPPFWVYNNYAYVYHQYLESYKKDTHYYVMGDYQEKPKLDESLQIKLLNNPNLRGIFFIENESFEWVEQVYYGHINEHEFIHDWKYSNYAINCFSLLYDLIENEIPWDNDLIINIHIYDFKNAGLYPDSQKLDLLVKEYLRKISSTNLDNFLSFHFNDCFDAFKFLVHVIEITDDIWKYSANDIECKKIFKKWIKEKIDFLEISNPQVLVDIYCSQKRIEYNESLISNSIPFEVFYNAKFEVKIYAFFQLNEKITPKPPQIQNNLGNKKLTLTGDKVAIYHVFKQLIAKQIIGENAKEVAEFLIRNVTGFENSDIGNLSTEIARDRKTNLETGTAGIAKKNKIDLD